MLKAILKPKQINYSVNPKTGPDLNALHPEIVQSEPEVIEN